MTLKDNRHFHSFLILTRTRKAFVWSCCFALNKLLLLCRYEADQPVPWDPIFLRCSFSKLNKFSSVRKLRLNYFSSFRLKRLFALQESIQRFHWVDFLVVWNFFYLCGMEPFPFNKLKRDRGKINKGCSDEVLLRFAFIFGVLLRSTSYGQVLFLVQLENFE